MYRVEPKNPPKVPIENVKLNPLFLLINKGGAFMVASRFINNRL